MPRKKTLHATERDTPKVRQARAAYHDEITGLPAERFKFIDEAGANIAMARLFGRAQWGQRVSDALPKNYGDKITLLGSGSLSCTCLDAVMTINGPVDTAVFRAYVNQVLGPTLRSGRPCCICRRIHRTGRQSSHAGPNSRLSCERPRRAHARRWKTRSGQRWTQSPQPMPAAGSRTAAMPYTDRETSLANNCPNASAVSGWLK